MAISLEEYVRQMYPPPEPDGERYGFYQHWGYEQWLIATYQYNLEQLMILNEPGYLRYLTDLEVAKQTGDNYAQQWNNMLQGKPIVLSKTLLTHAFQGNVAKGTPGIALWATDKVFCLFPTIYSRPLRDYFTLDEVEYTEQVFETEEQFLTLGAYKQHYCYVKQCEHDFVYLPGREGVWYVFQTWSRACQTWSRVRTVKLQTCQAEPKKRGKGYRKPPKSGAAWVSLSIDEFATIRRV